MKLKLIALSCFVTVGAYAQTKTNTKEPWSLDARGGPAIYNPANGEVPNTRKYVLSREGAEELRYKQLNPDVTEQKTLTVQPVVPTTVIVPEKPDWILNVPESNTSILAVGIGISNNEQRSMDKAILNAERRLIEVVNSEIETATRSTSLETGEDVQETFESFTRKNAYGQLIGTIRVKSYQIVDGNRYRTYVMMALPMDENNPIRKQREARQMKLDTETRNRMSYDSLDKQLKERQERDRLEAERRQQNIRPLDVPQAPPETVKEAPKVGTRSITPLAPLKSEVPAEKALAPGEVIIRPIPDNTVKEVSVIDMSNQQKQELIDKVSNETAKHRIAEALEKPDAVVMSATIQ